ncbi:putative integral membrane protein (TIGR02206 family) [Marmoricola sp. OAE513]|uniref:YwaF family protein n=1 Tax=Marmoricola sp. OAE513 TaxID=2817894 RepID=UPI001AE255CE
MPPLSTRFQAFGTEHLLLLTLFVVVLVAVVAAGRSRGDDPRFRRGFAIAIPCFTLPMQIWQLLPSDFGLGTSLPLQYCDLAWAIAAYALWTRKPWAVALTYFWGLTLTVQGIVTPSLGEQFPDPRYFMFFGMHFLTVWAAGYLVATGNRPTWALYRFAVVVTAAWALVVMTFNGITGTNYGYLNRKPPGASALDLLPGWPAYVVIEIVVIAGVWALMTWPFVRRAERVAV